MIGSEEEYARILRKPLVKPVEEKVEEPPEVSESEVSHLFFFSFWALIFSGLRSRSQDQKDLGFVWNRKITGAGAEPSTMFL